MDETCGIVRDLLPLYTEDLLRPESKAYVEAHLASCSACRAELEKLSRPVAVGAPLTPLRGLRRELRRRRLKAVLLSVALALTLAVSGFAFLTAPQYLPLDELTLVCSGLRTAEDGTAQETLLRDSTLSGETVDLAGIDSVQISLLTAVSGVKAEQSYDENGNVIYCVTAWRTLLDEWLGKYAEAPLLAVGDDAIGVIAGEETKTVIIAGALSQAEPLLQSGGVRTLTLDTRDCAGIYYAPNDGSESIMLLGTPGNGGMVMLPRLALGYYLLLSLALAAALGLAWLLFRAGKAGKTIGYSALVPLCYAAGHLITKGVTMTSYNLTRDLSLIMLAGTFLYSALLLGMALLRERKAG